MKYIELTQGKQAIVDDDLYDWLNQWKWYYKNAPTGEGGYACRNEGHHGKQKTIRMHMVINQTPPGLATDHINGNKLDNRRANLRSANHIQNGHNQGMHSNNTSGHKNIYWHKRDRKWRVQIRDGIRKVYVGSYKDLESAVEARDAAESLFHKDFMNAG